MERNRKAGQNPPRVVAQTEEEDEEEDVGSYTTSRSRCGKSRVFFFLNQVERTVATLLISLEDAASAAACVSRTRF